MMKVLFECKIPISNSYLEFYKEKIITDRGDIIISAMHYSLRVKMDKYENVFIKSGLEEIIPSGYKLLLIDNTEHIIPVLSGVGYLIGSTTHLCFRFKDENILGRVYAKKDGTLDIDHFLYTEAPLWTLEEKHDFVLLTVKASTAKGS